MNTSYLEEYLSEIKEVRETGQTTEGSYEPVLRTFLETFKVKAVIAPKMYKGIKPDVVIRRHGMPIGHIECKNLGMNLDKIENSEQVTLYRAALHNLILTNFIEYRWYTEGKCRLRASLGHFANTGRFVAAPNGEDDVLELLEVFMSSDVTPMKDPKELSYWMAQKARLLRATIRNILNTDTKGDLSVLLKAYRSTLIGDLDEEQFSDLMAQTVVYGLFAARCLQEDDEETFSLGRVFRTKTTRFLSEVLLTAISPYADERIEWLAEDITRLLAAANMEQVLSGLRQDGSKDDPLVYFYEDFLSSYSPEKRKKRGVYYTPTPVVSYIVRSVDRLLVRDFGIEKGLADHSKATNPADGRSTPRVLILDPAVGTGTFLREVIARIGEKLGKVAGVWDDYVTQHLLPRLFGFEVQVAPYAISHLKLALELGKGQEQFQMPTDHRINVFLTNALEKTRDQDLPYGAVAKESQGADVIKRDRHVMVVLGNPPYSKDTQNKGKWISHLLEGSLDGSTENYYEADGKRIPDAKGVTNDYVKFLRFAQWKVEQTGEGIIGFITANGYLDNVTLTGVRRSLLRIFDSIWILNVHRNWRKGEEPPAGRQDANVFDIEEGVCIGLFVKHSDSDSASLARVHYADLWGTLEEKYAYLDRDDVTTTEWGKPLVVTEPYYLFVPNETQWREEYNRGWPLKEIFRSSGYGIRTSKDEFTIHFTKAQLQDVVRDLASLTSEEVRAKYALTTEANEIGWRLAAAQEDVRVNLGGEGELVKILYAPFDVRHTYYTGTTEGFMSRPATGIMRHLLADPGRNMGLISARQTRHGCVASVSRYVCGNKSEDNYHGCTMFPLYLYPKMSGQQGVDNRVREPNFAMKFVKVLEDGTGMKYIDDTATRQENTFRPKDVFRYIYAVLHSPAYRKRYADFIKRDYPRIPEPVNRDMFVELSQIGKHLVSLHLMETKSPLADAITFDREGHNRVERVTECASADPRYMDVWINDDQYFGKVPTVSWTQDRGGYKPAKKWLVDRQGEPLGFQEIDTYRLLCAVLAETPKVMERIDTTMLSHLGWADDIGSS